MNPTANYIKIGLAATALTGGIVGAGLTLGKVIYDKVTEDSKEEADPRDSSFIQKNGVTEALVLEMGFHFEPGHPRLHHLYREHPLAQKQGGLTDKAGVYFSIEKYDDTLKEERKAELMRILIELGAVRIEITEESLNQSDAASSVSVGAEGKTGGGEAGISSSRRQETRISEKEVCTYDGKPWHGGDRLDRSEYAWLPFETKWKKIISGREVGGLLTASLRIESLQERADSIEVSAKMKAAIANLDAQRQTAASTSSRVALVLEVEFSKPLPERSGLAKAEGSGDGVN